MSIQAPPVPSLLNWHRLKVIGGLGLTQVVGWGTTFTPLTVIGTDLSRDLDLAREVVFGGITLMLLVSACLAPRLGRLVDRLGARPVMVTGSLIVALALLGMSMARGLFTYMVGWVLIGIAMPMMLSNAALPGLVQVIGPNARRAITALMLITGMTSTIFLPVTAILHETIGWRSAYLIFAAMHVLLCAPVHAWVLRRREDPAVEAGGAATPADARLPPDRRRAAFALIATWSCTEGLITWGLYMQVIDIFKGLGLSGATAIGVWAMVGPMQATARFSELLFGGRYSILTTSLAAATLTALSFLFVLPFGVSLLTASLFAACLGIGHGLFAIARNTLPLILFGVREYGAYMGLLMVPQNLVNAASPIIFAAAISRVSPTAGLWLAGLGAVTGLIAVLALVRICRRDMI